jgi:pimeloyl-ACP methyl ester carboxylesterase
MEELIFRDTKVRYSIEGTGRPLFLIHGYLEALEIWDGLARELSGDYRVIRMDLPGHGKSQVIKDTHEMELLAEAALKVLDQAGEEQCTMVGHSLGGYVTLAFMDLYPHRLNGCALFHSHPFADSDQVREKRQGEIDLVQQGKKEDILNTNIPKLFADSNLQALGRQVEWVRKIAEMTPGEGIVANLKGMMLRPDRSGLVKNTDRPFLMVAGRQDKYIDYNTVIPKIPIPERGKLVTLENSGHLGFLEEESRSRTILHDFMKKTGRQP